MKQPKKPSAMEAAVGRLRSIIIDADEGARIGSEDELVMRLECSRATVRQVARLLEREGVLKVRRGINGGYFAARPDARTIEAVVAAYLDTLDVDPKDATLIATTLWVEAMRKAALADGEVAAATVKKLTERVRKFPESASFSQIRNAEFALQADIFALANSPYIKLIFQINASYAQRRLNILAESIDSPAGAEFVASWKAAKLIELQAIASGDSELAATAGQHGRKVWHARLRRRYVGLASAS